MKGRTWTRGPIFILSIFLLLFAADARAGTTSLLLTGDPGDYISGGRTHFFTQADGTFTARINPANGVSLAFNTPGFSHWWYLDFAAPGKQFLTPGVYTGAVRYPYPYTVSGVPGLSVSGDGRGCNTLTGSFEVKEVVYGSSGTVQSFRATFEQHCEGLAPAARGEIRYNATVPIEITAPATISVLERQSLSFAVTAADTLGRSVSLSATGIPPGAFFADNGNNTANFTWVPAEGQAGVYTMAFQGRNGVDVETVHTTITVLAAPPANDDISTPVTVTDLPFTHTQTTTRATSAYDDPFCAGSMRTVWFVFTAPADMRVEINTFGSDYDTTLSVYTGTRGALSQIACNDNSARGPQSRVRFNATSGVTYFIMAAAYYGSPGGRLVLNVLPAPPPLTIALALAQSGGVDPTTGEVVVLGTITCSRPVLVTISGQLKQEHAQSSLTGQFAAAVACDESTDWATRIVLEPSLFRGRAAELFVGGKAYVTASASAVDHDAGETADSHAAAGIVLRGGY